MTDRARKIMTASISVALAAVASVVWLNRTGVRYADEVNYPVSFAFFALVAIVMLIPKRYFYLPVAAVGAVALCYWARSALICHIPALCLILLYKAAVDENRDRAASGDLYFCMMTILYCILCGVSFVRCVNMAAVSDVWKNYGASDFFDRDFYAVAVLFLIMTVFSFFGKLGKQTSSGKMKKDPGSDVRAAGKLRVFSVVSFLCIPANMIYPQIYINSEHTTTFPLLLVLFVFILYKNPFLPELFTDQWKGKRPQGAER